MHNNMNHRLTQQKQATANYQCQENIYADQHLMSVLGRVR